MANYMYEINSHDYSVRDHPKKINKIYFPNCQADFLDTNTDILDSRTDRRRTYMVQKPE